jgi:hypothetical protein
VANAIKAASSLCHLDAGQQGFPDWWNIARNEMMSAE